MIKKSILTLALACKTHFLK